jgi:uncharacterized protein (DUF58 family)
MEFEDHRVYSAGDDSARMDWLAFARGGVPVLKQFRAEEDVVVRLLLDASLSLSHGEPSKLDVARKVAAAVGYLALTGGERAELSVTRGETLTRFPARRGPGGVSALLQELGGVSASGRAGLPAAIEKLVGGARRPGLLVILSDFLEEGDIVAALRRAATAGHDLALVQVLSPEELNPSLEGDRILVDAETGEEIDVTLDARTLAAYRTRLDELFDTLRAEARSHRSTHVLARTDEPLQALVRRVVTGERGRGAA